MIDFTKLRDLIIEKKCVSSSDYGKEDPFIGIYWEDLIDIINQCDSIKCISVKEALPDYDVSVIAVDYIPEVYWESPNIIFTYRSKNPDVLKDSDDFCIYPPAIPKITHWMPMPEMKGGEK